MLFVLVVILAVIGLVSLLSGGAGGAVALLALPVLLFKLALVFMVIGFFTRGYRRGWHGGHHGPRRGPGWGGGRPGEPQRTDEDRFDEWHRMAHAREEVDSWVEGLPDAEPE